MKEVCILSGKGGTGKTSLAASFAVLAESKVVADCDVDAADLHLVLSPTIIQHSEFRSGHKAFIRQDDCLSCGACLARCHFEAVKRKGGGAGEATFTIDPLSCEGCGVCVFACPVKAIDFPESACGEWYVSETRAGKLVHAKLAAGAENSGKLVSIVRQEASRIAEAEKLELVLIDGPPGIGCPVIASSTGCDLMVIVTEPTLSGEHDLLRVAGLAKHFRIPTLVVVNKADINLEMAERIEAKAVAEGLTPLGRIRYDKAVTQAQMQGQALVEFTSAGAAEDMCNIWQKVKETLKA